MHKSKKTKKQAIFLTGAIVVSILVLSFISLSLIHRYQNPTIVGKWKSLDTGENVKFTARGEVIIDSDAPTGIYHIISPDTMEYTINGHTFTMIYHIDGRNLYWGIDEETLEGFIRK